MLLQGDARAYLFFSQNLPCLKEYKKVSLFIAHMCYNTHIIMQHKKSNNTGGLLCPEKI